VNEPAKVVVTITNIDSAFCFGYSDGSITTSTVGGSYGYTYTWNDPAAQSKNRATNLISGNYKLIVADYYGCTDSITATVEQPEEIVPKITSNQLCIIGVDYELSSKVTPDVKYKYNWMPLSLFNNIDSIKNPSIQIQKTTLIQLKLTNYKGCIGTDTMTLVGIMPINKILPNVFTPNSDNLNDSFGLPDIFEVQQFQIMNRWGNMVFQKTENINRWDGRFQGEYVPAGTYSYIIQAKLKNTDQLVSHLGTITIIK
jgi:gliding motility-associated-like protein